MLRRCVHLQLSWSLWLWGIRLNISKRATPQETKSFHVKSLLYLDSCVNGCSVSAGHSGEFSEPLNQYVQSCSATVSHKSDRWHPVTTRDDEFGKQPANLRTLIQGHCLTWDSHDFYQQIGAVTSRMLLAAALIKSRHAAHPRLIFQSSLLWRWIATLHHCEGFSAWQAVFTGFAAYLQEYQSPAQLTSAVFNVRVHYALRW